jgi:HEAT repeats
MKNRTLIFLLLAIASLIFWFQTNDGTKGTVQPKIVAQERVKPARLNKASAKPEIKYAENKAANDDLAVTQAKPIASTAINRDTDYQKVMIAPDESSLTDEANNPERRAEEDPAEAPKTALPENWAEITQAAIAEPDPQLRGEAIQNLSLYGNTEAIAVLTQVSVSDPDPNNREKAIQALWNSAADNPDSDDLKNQLEKSQGDPDPFVAELATKAIADLEHLAKSRRAN